MLRLITVAISITFITALSSRAMACSQPRWADDGRYVGGNLGTQIAEHADTIKVVRVTQRHLVRSTYREGSWYLRYGDTDAPSFLPAITHEYVYELSVAETIKGAAQAGSEYYENRLRILAYDGAEWRTFHREQRSASNFSNALPPWLLERPGRDGMSFMGGAAEGAGLGGGECNGPYFLEVGQLYLAFRDSMGRLYRNGIGAGRNSLLIQAEFRTVQGRRHRVSFALQALVPISGGDDPLIIQIREAFGAE